MMSERNEARVAAEGLVKAIKAFQDSVELFDATAAASLEINTTDLRCLTALRDQGALTAGEVAQKLGLTRGATTTAIDRLEACGYLARRANAEDGRSVWIDLTVSGRNRVDATWSPMRLRGREHLRSYSIVELHFLRRFFERSVELQVYCTELLRDDSVAPPARAPASSRAVSAKRAPTAKRSART